MENITLCVSLHDDCLKQMKKLKKSALLSKCKKLKLVHCFEIQVYTSDFSPFVFPTQEKFPEIEKTAREIMGPIRKELEEDGIEVETFVFFDHSPKQKIIDFLKEQNQDLAVVATRGKHGIEGLFSSSFAEHLIRYSPCNLHILRPED